MCHVYSHTHAHSKLTFVLEFCSELRLESPWPMNKVKWCAHIALMLQNRPKRKCHGVSFDGVYRERVWWTRYGGKCSTNRQPLAYCRSFFYYVHWICRVLSPMTAKRWHSVLLHKKIVPQSERMWSVNFHKMQPITERARLYAIPRYILSRIIDIKRAHICRT